MPQTAAPIVAIPLPESSIPLAYHLHVKPFHCTNCGTQHPGAAECYAFNTLRSRSGARTVNSLVPVKQFLWKIPIQTTVMPSVPVPVCQLCVPSLSLDHLPDGVREREWQIASARKALEASRAAQPSTTSSKPKSRPLTPAEVLSLL